MLETINHGRMTQILRRGRTLMNTNKGMDHVSLRVCTSSARKTPLASIWRHLSPSRHLVVSRDTIRIRLPDASIKNRHQLRRLPRTLHHRHLDRISFDLGQVGFWLTGGMWSSSMNPDSLSVMITTSHDIEGSQTVLLSGICCQAAYSNYTRCYTVGRDFLEHTVTSNHTSSN